jgi:hypothetical protein
MPFLGRQPTPVPLTSSDITDGIITTDKIVDDAVTGAKIENSPTIANGLTLADGNLVVASGHGIDFSANTNVGTMTSELFDHYEEGTFDITVADATSGGNTGSVVQTNKYIRIGNTVWLQFNLINVNYTGLSTSNNLYFQGLPFTPATGSNGASDVSAERINIDSTTYNQSIFVNAGQSYASLYQSRDTDPSVTTTVGALNNGVTDIFCTVMFMV